MEICFSNKVFAAMVIMPKTFKIWNILKTRNFHDQVSMVHVTVDITSLFFSKVLSAIFLS